MSLFHFALRPVTEIQPWDRDGRPWLSWFGLSDGWYWLEMHGQELFRVCEEERVAGTLPYVDYQVARLWEDFLCLVPDILAEVPDDVASRVGDPDGWYAAVERIYAAKELDKDLVSYGLGWWSARCLSSLHLAAPPLLWMWRTGQTLHEYWRSSTDPVGARYWRPAAGYASVPVEHFLADLQAFDDAFLGSMGERVESLVRAGGRTGVEIDLQQLEAEQRDRSTWLERALRREPTGENDWEAARELLARSAKAGLL